MKATTASTEFVVCREPHIGQLANGTEYVCRFREIYRANSEEARLQPQYFVPVGQELVPYERPEVCEPDPPPPPPKPTPRMLRVRKTWESGVREIKSPWGVPERVRISLHEGREVREDDPMMVALTKAERRDLFEFVES